jgi:magnesium-transporting ATPase (P-type)
MRENFSFKPSVLVLGSLAGHSAMLGKASVSVAVISEKSRNFYFRADVLIPSFNHLEELILNQGQSFYLKISKIFHLFLLKEVIFIVILFLYQFSSAFSATFFTDFELFVTFELLVTFFPVMIFAVLKKNEGCIKEKSLFYAKNLENCFSRKNLVFYGVFGIFEGVLIFGFIQFGLGNLADSDGMTEDLEVRGTLFFIVMSLSFLFKILVMMQKLNTFTLFSHFFTLLLIGFCVFLTFFGKLSSYSNSLCIFSNQSVFWILATTLPLCLIAFYMFFSAFYFTIIEMKFKSKIEMFKNCLEKVFHTHKKLKKDKNVDGLEICRKTLSFNSEYQEMKYKNHLSKIHHHKLKVMIWLVSIFILVFLCFLYAGVVELKFKLFAVLPAFMSCSFAFITLKKKLMEKK